MIIMLTLLMFYLILGILVYRLIVHIRRLNTLPSYTIRLNTALDKWKIETANKWKELDEKLKGGHYGN